jgi:hypothetical protein
VRITIPHYYDFGEDRILVGDDLVRPAAWDALRTRTSGPFALPATREEWKRAAEANEEIAERARRVDAFLGERGVESLASYGVGGAVLEYWLQRLRPERRLVLGEYAPATVARLRDVFPEVEIEQHDLLTDSPLPADWHLFHRIDTEFTNREWRSILRRFGGEPVLVVATQILDWNGVLVELRRRGLRHRATRAGMVRNGSAFESLWRRTHVGAPLELHDLQGWVLSPRSKS